MKEKKRISNFFYNYSKNYELINRFNYFSHKKCAKLLKVAIVIKTTTYNFKSILASALCLEFIFQKKGHLIFSKKNNVKVQIKKGSPVGCKLCLLKTSQLYFFIKKYIFHKTNAKFVFNKQSSNICFNTDYFFNIPELKKFYIYFKYINNLNMTLSLCSKKKKELLYTLKMYKIS